MPPILDRLRSALESIEGANYELTPSVATEVRYRAAVMILLLPQAQSGRPKSDWFSDGQSDEEEYDILLTRRSLNLRVFPGHTAFPGGKLDPSDLTIIHTALREANEEVGVEPEEITILGVLPPLLGRYGHLTYGVVGFLDDRNSDWTRPVNEMELDDVFRVPMRRFLSTRGLHMVRPVFLDVPTIMIGIVDVVGNDDNLRIRETWGMTAIFAIVTAAFAYKRKPEFPEFYASMGIMNLSGSLNRTFQMHNEFLAGMLVRSRL